MDGLGEGGRGMRAAALALALVLSAPIGAGAAEEAVATGEPSPGSSPEEPATSPGAHDGLLREDIFTTTPDPLTLTSTLDRKRGTSKVIGPRGGRLRTRGEDGTRYTLDVPRNALAMGTRIRMTPIESLTGFPDGPPPEHVLGVQLHPDGLVLGATATLTVQPRRPPDPELAVLDYEGDGAEAGFHDFDAQGRRITFAIDHFSGYAVSFPLEVERIRAIAERQRTDPARVLESEIASLIALDYQRGLLGEDPQFTLDDLARHFLPLFVEVVLLPRVAAAGRGCAQAEAAMAAILSYQRQRQRLGVGDDPAFELPTGAGGAASSLLQVPARLVDLKVRLCFREAHARCVRDGDFPGMAAYFWATFRQGRNRFELDPTAEQLELAHGYLRRCGRYRATLKLDVPAVASERFQREERFTLEVELEWKPGDGLWGILGSTIDGEGEHADIDFAFRSAGCVPGDRISSTRTDEPGQAKIELLTYDLLFGPTLTGEPLPPQPRELVLLLAPGTIRFVSQSCAGGRDRLRQEYATLLAIFGLADPGATRDLRAGALRIDRGWTFAIRPFRADWEFHKMYPPDEGGLGLDLKVTLLHEPT